MEDLDLAIALLRAESTIALATQGREHHACVAPLFYLLQDGPALYWFSSPDSEHSRNLTADPRCSATVFSQTEHWRDIRGVQMRGCASAMSDPEIRDAIMVTYKHRFRLSSTFDMAIAGSSLYCFRPEWLRYLDNSRGFGYQFEITIP